MEEGYYMCVGLFACWCIGSITALLLLVLRFCVDVVCAHIIHISELALYGGEL